MGLCTSVDIFQYKIDNLLGDTKSFSTYINNILVLGKGVFNQHIEHTRIVFSGMRATGLKFNDPKCRFYFKYITYLGYIIKR